MALWTSRSPESTWDPTARKLGCPLSYLCAFRRCLSIYQGPGSEKSPQRPGPPPSSFIRKHLINQRRTLAQENQSPGITGPNGKRAVLAFLVVAARKLSLAPELILFPLRSRLFLSFSSISMFKFHVSV